MTEVLSRFPSLEEIHPGTVLIHPNLEFFPTLHAVRNSNGISRLTDTESRLTLRLFQSYEKVVEYPELFNAMSSNTYVPSLDDNMNVRAKIHRLRDSLQDIGLDPNFVETSFNRGYSLRGKEELRFRILFPDFNPEDYQLYEAFMDTAHVDPVSGENRLAEHAEKCALELLFLNRGVPVPVKSFVAGGVEGTVTTGSLRVQIHRVRSKLGLMESSTQPNIINIRSYGYMMKATGAGPQDLGESQKYIGE